MSLQVCHCGWSKRTTYHGLRTHQGIMGCTPKGMRIPQELQWSLPRITYPTPKIKIEDPIIIPVYKPDPPVRDLTDHLDVTGYMSTIKSKVSRSILLSDKPPPAVKEFGLLSPDVHSKTPSCSKSVKIEAGASALGINLDETFQFLDFDAFLTSNNVPSPGPAVTESSESIFQTPRHVQKTSGSKLDKARRALDFSIVEQQATQERMKADLQQKIQDRQRRIVDVRLSAGACSACLDAEWLKINDVFSRVITLVQDARQKALQPLEDRVQKVKNETRIVVQSLEREIDALEKVIRESESQVPATTSLETHVDTSLSFGSLRAVTSTMMNKIQQELEKLSSVELTRIPRFSVDVKLDPTTAHRNLAVSADGKTVRDGNNAKVPDSAERFNEHSSILATNRLGCGRAYWEVEVTNKSGWDLGVTRCGANRKGKLALNPKTGYWVVIFYEGKQYAAMTAPPTRICREEKPTKVGVFVDYEEGLVSFYDVTARSHVYSFTNCQFGEEIRPYFSPHRQSETNEEPLVICAP